MEDKEELKSQIEWMEEDLNYLKSQLTITYHKHYKNNKDYIITGKCLIQENSKWIEAYIYKEKDGNQLFCRSKNEFNLKFKEI